MKLLSATQTRALDQATIQEQGITSVDLMERAAQALLFWLYGRYLYRSPADILVLCGPGNNGGDGLALARLLHEARQPVRVARLPSARYSADYEVNLARLPAAVPQAEIRADALPAIQPTTLVVDALFGSGLSRPLAGLAAALVHHLNASGAAVVAVDVPSGLATDSEPRPAVPDSPADLPAAVVRATHTVSFGQPHLAFLLPQNAAFVGEWHVEDIGLSRAFIESADTPWHLTGFLQADLNTVDITWPPRPAPVPELSLPRREKFAYKNTFGHALLLAGSRGKLGAAVLAAGACLRGGVGLLTVRVPGAGLDVLQISQPEAMGLPDPNPDFISELPDLSPYQAVGLGPGVGQNPATAAVLRALLTAAALGADRPRPLPLVLDADALNLLGAHRELLALLPENTVLTPHVGEFTRLTEAARDDYHRLALLREFAQKHRVIVVLKGAYSAVAAPDGQVYFNPTGNPGMATGGSGDCLTGLLLALRADQRLPALTATRLAVLAHGRAGDLAAAEIGEAGLVAGDIVRFLGPALRELIK